MPRSVLPPGVLSKDGRKAFEATRQESDLACALILASYIDQCLGSLLQSFLAKSTVTEGLLDPRAGPLGTFESRARMTYALRLVSKPQYQNLDRIAQIRNLFAHSHIDIKFEEPSIQELCAALVLPEIQFQGATPEERSRARDGFIDRWLATPRMQYVWNSLLIANALILRAITTEQQSGPNQT